MNGQLAIAPLQVYLKDAAVSVRHAYAGPHALDRQLVPRVRPRHLCLQGRRNAGHRRRFPGRRHPPESAARSRRWRPRVPPPLHPTASSSPSLLAAAGFPLSSKPHPRVAERRYVRPDGARRRVLPARAPSRGPQRLMTRPCALPLATPRGCSIRTVPHPSLLAGDRQVLARGGCCIWQGILPVLMPLQGLAPVSPYLALRPTGRLSLHK